MFYLAVSIFTLIVCFFLNNLNIDSTIISSIFISSMSIIMLIKILHLKCENILKAILVIALFARIVLVFTDVYLFRLPDTGKDDDGFYRNAFQSYISGESFDFKVYGTYFTYVLYLLMHIIGTSRIGVQFINVIFSMISLMAIVDILKILKVDIKFKKIILFFMCFMPYIMFSNSILRRDTLISVLTVLSIKNFIKWIYNKKIKYCIISCFYIILAALFHAAVVFTFAIYLTFYFLYNHKIQKVKFAGTGYLKTIIISIIVVLFGIYFLSNFNSKFSHIDSMEVIYSNVNESRGGSVYLKNVKISTISQLLIWAPVKFVYFIFSPMPWNFRNILDVATFLMDSSVYLFLLLQYIKSKNKKSSSKWLFLCFLIVGLVFSLGTFNSGTAIRHRYNILPFLIIIYAIEKSNSNNTTLNVQCNAQ